MLLTRWGRTTDVLCNSCGVEHGHALDCAVWWNDYRRTRFDDQRIGRYVVDAINQGRGVNEILAINDHELLALERDNRSMVPTPPNAAQLPNLKRIYRITLNGATDVSDVASLPATGAELAPDIVPVTKTLLIDLLNPSYMVNATETIRNVIAEKMEALAWGPDLSDGRHVLYVFSDNDLFPGRPTQIYAFAIDGSAGAANLDFQRQRVLIPTFPVWLWNLKHLVVGASHVIQGGPNHPNEARACVTLSLPRDRPI